MTITACYKYLEFLNVECDRYLADSIISEEEISHLAIEFELFKKKVEKSDLPTSIKTKVSGLKLDHSYSASDFRELFPSFSRVLQSYRNRKLKRKIEAFKFQIKGLPMFIRMNF